jgi:hypothetical protein
MYLIREWMAPDAGVRDVFLQNGSVSVGVGRRRLQLWGLDMMEMGFRMRMHVWMPRPEFFERLSIVESELLIS